MGPSRNASLSTVKLVFELTRREWQSTTAAGLSRAEEDKGEAMQEGGENGRGGQLRKASTESSQARPKKVKTAGESASGWHGGEV